MRKRDIEQYNGKAAKTISFDFEVLRRIEDLSKQERTTSSKLVNAVCRQHLLSQFDYHRAMAKYYYMKFQEHNYMKEQFEKDIVKKQPSYNTHNTKDINNSDT